MSVDWCKYAKPEETKSRAKSPNDYCVVSFVVGDIREMVGAVVAHAPLPENQAHTNVLGAETDESKAQLRDLYHVEIRLPDGRPN